VLAFRKFALTLTILLLTTGATRLRAAELFSTITLPGPDRSVAAELADLNGDQRVDLFVVTLRGVPPIEERAIRVFLQRADGSFPSEPDHQHAMPRWSAVYDIADLRADVPGEEMVVLQPDGVSVLSIGGPELKSWHLTVPGPTTAGLADDERGLEPYKLVFSDFGPEPWILVPQIGHMTALAPDGTVRAQFVVPRRANYFIIPQTGLVSLESDFQVFLDIPKLTLGDIDGDGQTDVVTSTRHEIFVFIRQEDGAFAEEPSRRIPLALVEPRDHIRGSGGVTSDAKDIDGDGRLDLLISHVKGSFADATTTIRVYMNHGKGWAMESPDQTIVTDSSLSSNALFDLDSDGRQELLRISFKFSLLEVVEILLSSEVDVDISTFKLTPEGGFSQKPWVKKKVSLPFSFDTFRLKGFMPTANEDVNGDGFLDFVSSGGGEALEVHIGGPKGPFQERSGRQKMKTAGVIHFRDFNRDRLPDFVLFDPHNFDVPIRLGKNLGALPGSRPVMQAVP
jgi:hypothetical protein